MIVKVKLEIRLKVKLKVKLKVNDIIKLIKSKKFKNLTRFNLEEFLLRVREIDNYEYLLDYETENEPIKEKLN